MTNNVSELSPYGLYNAMHGSDASVAHFAQGAQGSLSILQSITSPISLQESAFVSGPGILPASYEETCEPILASGVNPSFGFPQGLDFNNVLPMGEQYHTTWSYPTPVDDNFLFSNEAFVQSANAVDERGLYREWTSESFQAGANDYSGTVPCDSQPMAWPPIPAVDSSVASSYSHNSMLGHLPNSPLSSDIQEDAIQCANLDDGLGIYPVLNIGDALPYSFPMDGADSRTDTRFVEVSALGIGRLTEYSTLKPGRDFQRTPMPNLDSWSQGDISTSQSYMTVPFIARRRSSEGETTTAREHQFYQVGPGVDGLYHCPYAADDGCTHKPEKLKCNYE